MIAGNTGSQKRAHTANACKLCAPLGASLVFKGIAGCAPFLHGSQGCATYIRRYLIGHFREPVDIAASNFTEAAAIFGGEEVFTKGVANVARQYTPRLIGAATTCLAETIGDDLTRLQALASEGIDGETQLITVSTPSYAGTHAEGFQAAVKTLLDRFAEPGEPGEHLCLLPGMVSPADLRHLKDLVAAFGLEPILVPNYSETLDGGSWSEHQVVPEGGTTLEDLARCGSARAILECGRLGQADAGPGAATAYRCQLEHRRPPLPIGIEATDAFLAALSEVSGRDVPEKLQRERLRLVDALVDGHKFLSGKTVALYGEAELCASMAAWCWEVGLHPTTIMTGANGRQLEPVLEDLRAPGAPEPTVLTDDDFGSLREVVANEPPDLLLGHGKGYHLARAIDRPLVRIGFPVQDRVGGGRLRLCGYEGALQLFDRVANTLIERQQTVSPVGYMAY